MKELGYEAIEDLRSIDRSPYRNMSSDCAYCGYRNRPSSSKDICSNSSCHQNYKSSKTNKR